MNDIKNKLLILVLLLSLSGCSMSQDKQKIEILAKRFCNKYKSNVEMIKHFGSLKSTITCKSGQMVDLGEDDYVSEE